VPREDHAIAQGARCTWFLTPSNPVTARKKWIAGSLEPRGVVHVDAGAARAVMKGGSLLPAGVTRVEGAFARGDCILIRDASGAEIGRGLVAYDAAEAGQLVGRNSRDIEAVLGAPGRAEMIHRDDMALVGD
jgi:glutamate 5-kinase